MPTAPPPWSYAWIFLYGLWGSNASSHAASKHFTDRTSLQPLADNLTVLLRRPQWNLTVRHIQQLASVVCGSRGGRDKLRGCLGTSPVWPHIASPRWSLSLPVAMDFTSAGLPSQSSQDAHLSASPHAGRVLRPQPRNWRTQFVTLSFSLAVEALEGDGPVQQCREWRGPTVRRFAQGLGQGQEL